MSKKQYLRSFLVLVKLRVTDLHVLHIAYRVYRRAVGALPSSRKVLQAFRFGALQTFHCKNLIIYSDSVDWSSRSTPRFAGVSSVLIVKLLVSASIVELFRGLLTCFSR